MMLTWTLYVGNEKVDGKTHEQAHVGSIEKEVAEDGW